MSRAQLNKQAGVFLGECTRHFEESVRWEGRVNFADSSVAGGCFPTVERVALNAGHRVLSVSSDTHRWWFTELPWKRFHPRWVRSPTRCCFSLDVNGFVARDAYVGGDPSQRSGMTVK